jgi:hypothetical protein
MNEIKELVLTPLLAEARFVIIWLFAPIVLIGVYELLCLLIKDDKKQVLPQENSAGGLIRKPNLDLLSSMALAFFLIFLTFYIYLMFFKEDFAYYDNFVFTHTNLAGKPYFMPIWRDSGRFWPLGLQEYNFLALIGKNFVTYQGFSVFQLLIVLLAINQIFLKFPTWHRLATMTLVMVTPSFVWSFFGLIFPERNVIFWLSLLILCCHALMTPQNAGSRVFIYGALISAQFCLYYKEPVFVMIGSFAGIRLALNFLNQGKKSDSKTGFFVFLKRNYIDFSLILLSILFFILYQYIVASQVVEKYQYNSQETVLGTFHSYIDNNFLVLSFIGAVIVRILYLFCFRKHANILWDSLALGALFYFLVFLMLRMQTLYYLAPVEFVAVMYLSWLVYGTYNCRKVNEVKLKRFLERVLIVALTSLVISQSLQGSAKHIIQRKSMIQGQVQLTGSIRQYAETSGRNSINLFFPLPTGSYSITNFAAFLEYKGGNLYYEKDSLSSKAYHESLESFKGVSEPSTTFTLKSPLNFEKNLCVSWFWFECFQAMEPESEDLIVLLPGLMVYQDIKDLKARLQDINGLKARSKVLFTYNPKENFSKVEKILLAISRHDFPGIDVYILQEL